MAQLSPPPGPVLLRGGLILVALLGLSGCLTPTHSVTVERILTQDGLALAPGGPQAAGPMLEAGAIGLEAGLRLPINREGDGRFDPEAGAATGNTSPDLALRGRLSGAPDRRVEVGLGFEYANAGWGTTSASADAYNDNHRAASAWRIAPDVRVLLSGDAVVGLGLQLELGVMGISHQRRVYEKAFATDFVDGVPTAPDYLGARLDEREDSDVFFSPKAGLFMTGQLGDVVSLTGGMLTQRHPAYFGARRADMTCTYYEERAAPICDGTTNVDDIDAVEGRWLGTLHLSVGVALGRVLLITQVYGHVLGDDALRAHAPMGVDLGARVVF